MGERTARDDEKIRVSDKISINKECARDDEKIRVSDKISINKECGNAFMEKIKPDHQCLIVPNVQQERKRKF